MRGIPLGAHQLASTAWTCSKILVALAANPERWKMRLIPETSWLRSSPILGKILKKSVKMWSAQAVLSHGEVLN